MFKVLFASLFLAISLFKFADEFLKLKRGKGILKFK